MICVTGCFEPGAAVSPLTPPFTETRSVSAIFDAIAFSTGKLTGMPISEFNNTKINKETKHIPNALICAWRALRSGDNSFAWITAATHLKKERVQSIQCLATDRFIVSATYLILGAWDKSPKRLSFGEFFAMLR
jgi:hypothetical protein